MLSKLYVMNYCDEQMSKNITFCNDIRNRSNGNFNNFDVSLLCLLYI